MAYHPLALLSFPRSGTPGNCTFHFFLLLQAILLDSKANSSFSACMLFCLHVMLLFCVIGLPQHGPPPSLARQPAFRLGRLQYISSWRTLSLGGLEQCKPHPMLQLCIPFPASTMSAPNSKDLCHATYLPS